MEAKEALEALNTARVAFRGTLEDHMKLQHAVEVLRQMVEVQAKEQPVVEQEQQ